MQTHTNGYGVNRTPVPLDSGYAAAAQQWDKRMGLAAKNMRLWRATALGSLGLCVVLSAGLAYAASRRQVEMFVVEVDPAEARTIGVEMAGRNYTPDASARAYFVADLVRKSRSRTLDPVVQAERWKNVYAFLAGPAEQRMNEYAAADTGLGSDGRKVAREVQIGTVLQQGENTYQVRWTERTYAAGTLQEGADYTGLFSVTHEPPTDKRAILTNPIGLYVTEINWGRDFSASTSTRTQTRQPNPPSGEAATE
jgi:type IV secretion system protein VirB5